MEDTTEVKGRKTHLVGYFAPKPVDFICAIVFSRDHLLIMSGAVLVLVTLDTREADSDKHRAHA